MEVRDHATADDSTAPSDSASYPTWSRRVLSLALPLALVVAVGMLLVERRHVPTTADVDARVAAQLKPALAKAAKDAANAPARSAQVFQAIAPSLVLIVSDETGPEVKGDKAKQGLGTGVIINAQGAILTANHVVSQAKRIRVTFADGTTGTARIVSQKPENDIAVLEADTAPEVIVPAVMGSAGQIGDDTYAVGNPLGLIDSMSAGVISGLGRSIPAENGVTLKGLIQFDAAVNPGNSGGPLLNRNGQVIGIVTALANPSEQGFFVGIGFAVPIGTAGGAAGSPPQ